MGGNRYGSPYHVRDSEREAGMNRAVFLDRDGTINVERHYLHRVEDFEFLPGAVQGLRRLQDIGYLLVIVTNQSGIARGYYTEEDFKTLNEWMLARLKESRVTVSGVYYCPHLTGAASKYGMACGCRKPALGLFQQAVRDLDIDVGCSWAIGDKIRDCSICEGTGCRGILIGSNEKPGILERVRRNGYRNVRHAADLAEAVGMILEGEQWLL